LQPALDRELEVVARVVSVRVGSEAARRAVLESLVDRQDDEAAGACERAGVHQARQIVQYAGILARVPAKNLSHSLAHDLSSSVSKFSAARYRPHREGRNVFPKKDMAVSPEQQALELNRTASSSYGSPASFARTRRSAIALRTSGNVARYRSIRFALFL
jgi:hypothetical protein